MKTTVINKNLVLHEPSGGIYYGTDALLLAYFTGAGKLGQAVELGCGSGVISLLLLAAGADAVFTGIELQPEYCRAAEKNALENGFAERFRVIEGDVRQIRTLYPAGAAKTVMANPPYLPVGAGEENRVELKRAAFRELNGGILDFCRAAGWCLQPGGKFFVVYRADRLAGLFRAMQETNIEPKRLQTVHPRVGKAAQLVLVEGKKDAAEGLVHLPPLYLYADEAHTMYTPEFRAVYEAFK